MIFRRTTIKWRIWNSLNTVEHTVSMVRQTRQTFTYTVTSYCLRDRCCTLHIFLSINLDKLGVQVDCNRSWQQAWPSFCVKIMAQYLQMITIYLREARALVTLINILIVVLDYSLRFITARSDCKIWHDIFVTYFKHSVYSNYNMITSDDTCWLAGYKLMVHGCTAQVLAVSSKKFGSRTRLAAGWTVRTARLTTAVWPGSPPRWPSV